MKNLKNINGIFIFIFSFFIAGCNEISQEPLRIASSPWPGYEPLYLARDLGYLNEKKINLFELPSSDITMESFRNHSTDIATLTLDETLELMHDGAKLRIITVMDISHGGDAVLANPAVKKLSDIKGKRIAIVNIPLGMYMLSRVLEKAGLERKDVSVFPMAESKQFKFYQQGKADVIITFEPVKTQLQEAGAKVIFDSSQIPDEIFDLLVVHEDVYLKRRQDICEVVNAWFKSLQYLKTQEKDAHLRMSRRLGVKANTIPAMMEGIIIPSSERNKRILGGSLPEIVRPAKKLSNLMFREEMLQRPVDVMKAVDPEFTRCY